MAGCDKESSDNGDLDGFWQMTEKMDGFCGTMGGADMRQSGLTWAFQGHILELRDVTDHQKDIMMSFEHKGGELRVSLLRGARLGRYQNHGCNPLDTLRHFTDR